MSDIRRGIPITRSRLEKIFPKLTPAQISRIEARGHIRDIQLGEVLVEQGESIVPFFVVVSGELEVIRPSGAVETLITIHIALASLLAKCNMLSGRRAIYRDTCH